MFIRLFSLWVDSGFNYLHEDIQLQQWRQNLTFTHTDCIKPFLNETNVCDGMITQFGGETKKTHDASSDTWTIDQLANKRNTRDNRMLAKQS